tara:strand:- start:2018 stop:2257 length:240 start_codon:yes stop_codon:yes gene_type:complete
MMEETHGWYSEKQLEILIQSTDNKRTNRPYIYYLDQNNKIVQVTEVTYSSDNTSKFDDVKYVGVLSKFHSSSVTPKSMA